MSKPADSAVGAGNLKWAIAVTVALGTFMDVLDNSSVSVALEYIGGNLGASQDDVTWVITILLVAKAVTLPTAGYLATVVGRSRLFMIALVAYGVASLLCGLSTSLGMLLVMRAFQGICGGIIPPLGQAILKDSFPAKERGQAFALYGVATVVAPTVGPLLCGWLVDHYSWHWVFFVNVPVAMLTAFLVTVLVKDPPELVKEKAAAWAKGLSIDYIGLGLLGIGLSALQYVLSRGERFDWFSSDLILYTGIASVILLVSGIIWETRTKKPAHRPEPVPQPHVRGLHPGHLRSRRPALRHHYPAAAVPANPARLPGRGQRPSHHAGRHGPAGADAHRGLADGQGCRPAG